MCLQARSQEKGGPWGSCLAAGALSAIARSYCPGAKRAVRSRLHVALSERLVVASFKFRVQRFRDVDFFKAKLIKSFDINPTHPGPASKRQLPLTASATQQTRRKKKSGGRPAAKLRKTGATASGDRQSR